MSDQWPQSFVWENGEVITFENEQDVRVCRENCKWTYQDVVRSSVWKPLERKSSPELTALRRFHSAVMQATQTESNSRLPQAIFAADAEVRRVMSETN